MDEATPGALQPLIRECLQSLTNEPSSLIVEFCKGLCRDPPPLPSISEDHPAISGKQHVLFGYPDHPLYKRLSNAEWMITGRCPVLELPEMYMLNEQDTLADRSERLEAASQKLTRAHSLWDHWSIDEKKATLIEFLESLGVRGILDLLGIRKTAGSYECLPPSREVLMSTFTAPHSPNAKLSVGARALSKHCHRDDSEQWWGTCTGSEDAKNAHAVDRVTTILREAAWINIHSLPHDVKVIEVRIKQGYGARWSHDGSEFRGFLEPQMTDGHQVGWRH